METLPELFSTARTTVETWSHDYAERVPLDLVPQTGHESARLSLATRLVGSVEALRPAEPFDFRIDDLAWDDRELLDLTGTVDISPERITLQALVKPLVGWIWYGGLVISVGTLIALWPTGDMVRRRPTTSVAAAEPVGAGV